MRTIDRTITNFLVFSWTILSLIMMLLAFGWNYPLHYFSKLLQDVNNRWMLGLVGGLIFVSSILYVIKSIKSKPINNTIINNGKLGIVSITLTALENLVNKVSKMQNGVREVKSHIKTTPNGVAVHVSISVIPDVNIPDITLKIQEAIKESFKKTAGMDVEEVRVLVTKISYDTKARVE